MASFLKTRWRRTQTKKQDGVVFENKMAAGFRPGLMIILPGCVVIILKRIDVARFSEVGIMSGVVFY